MFVVAARYYTQEGRDDDVAAVLREMVPISNAEPGCALYVVNRSTEDPRAFLLYEQYHDRAGYEAHTETEAFKEKILGTVVPMLESRVRDFYEVLEPA
ncbi:MAG: antibiotic biosynthesis monooxygenase [Chloroflexota bacterium]|nr:antibiotic biosynthesis monooxygenase [Chloroflexota bacterium]